MHSELPKKEIETLLQALRPAELSEHVVDRLTSAVDGTLIYTPQEYELLERNLSFIAPRKLSADLFDKLENIVIATPFPLDQKVILFPGAHKQEAVPSHHKEKRTRLLAIAAVAAMGGLAAFLIPTSAHKNVEVARRTQTLLPLTTANFGTNTKSIKDEALIWSDQAQPQRVYRVEYQDRVLTRDAQGIERMLLVPHQELIVVPTKVD